MKYYIVQKLGYVYNDEIYSHDSDSGGSPEKVFKTSNSAQEWADELNAKEFSECPISTYGYGADEIFNDVEAFIKTYAELFGKTLTEDVLYDFELPELTLKQYKTLKRHFKITFFEVIEVGGEEEIRVSSPAFSEKQEVEFDD